jgi:hypothetical protein
MIFWSDSEYISMMKCSQGPGCMTGLSHLKKAEQRLKYSKIAPSAGKVMVSVFWDTQGVLLIPAFSDGTNHKRSLLIEDF